MNRNDMPPVTPRKCARRECPASMAGRSLQARYCCEACKQADYRERHDPANAPTARFRAPGVAHVERADGGRWRVVLEDGAAVVVDAYSEAQARVVARWRVAEVVG